MNTCLSCARKHDSWFAYCTNCMQTQAILKQMEEAERRRKFNSPVSQPLPPPNYSGYSGYSGYSEPSRFSWLLENNLGLISLWAWKFYMLWTFITGANFTTTDFVAGLVFFIWAANER